jgi:ABC-type nitrate/sulfonate/bicarbonate transport system substrate-binding protein
MNIASIWKSRRTRIVHRGSASALRLMWRTTKSLIAVLLFWTAAGHGAEPQLPLFRLGYSGAGIAQNLTYVIDKSGLWTKHNIDVRSIYFTSGTIMAQALVGGDIDVTDSNIPTMLNLKAAGLLDVKIVAVWMNKILLSFIARHPIKSPAELKGKKLGISRFGSSSDFITRLLLRYWKLDPEKDVTIIQAGGNDSVRMAALIGGHLDGALIGSHDVPKLLESGCCNNLADLEELPIDYSRFGIALPASLIKARRDHVRRYLQALSEGIYVYKTRPELPIALLKREGVKDADLAYQKITRALIEYPVPEEKGIQIALDSIGTPKAKQAQARDYIDASILEEIRKSGFIDRLYGKQKP